ncbi:Peroxidase, family 2-domain-containing protein [Paramyrothecium foliicola]|nr:Peroxidase, family 2-domain-containing protein [Paramyrothecium foliicola]
MKFAVLATTLSVFVSSAKCTGDAVPEWHPPTPNDFRGPCPMMNTLANHGYLQRDGRNITREAVRSAMSGALNFDAALADIMFDQAIIANPEPNATFFTLDDLNRHNVLEHDASLRFGSILDCKMRLTNRFSRSDAFFGNNFVFNQTIFDETRQYWSQPVLTANMLAMSKLARQVTSKAFNPTYTFTESTERFSEGEVAAPVIAFGNTEDVTVDKALVEYFFLNERLPTELGWVRKQEVVGLQQILRVSGAIRSAASLITGKNSTETTVTSGQNLHSAMGLQANRR